MRLTRLGERIRRGGELDAAVVELAEDGLGGDFLVHDEHLRVGSRYGFPVVAEGDDLAVLGCLGEVGVGVDQVVRAGVLREEGQHAARTLRPGGHVVLFQGGIVAPCHHGVKIQVENGLVARGEPAGDHLLVQGGQEPLLVVVGQPAGVVGERGLLGQDRQPGQQGGAGSVSRSSTWLTRRVAVSLRASRDSRQLAAGIVLVAG
jgi:hypothetical protein